MLKFYGRKLLEFEPMCASQSLEYRFATGEKMATFLAVVFVILVMAKVLTSPKY
jgi:hypothetical protein